MTVKIVGNVPKHRNQFTDNPKTLEERFWEKVDKKSDSKCWEWTASLRSDGYGQLHYIQDGRRYCLPAHRLSWSIHFKEVPHGKQVLHRCDNPKCVNPNHLFLGTNEDNRQDMVNKKRHMFGEKHISAKLKETNILYIRRAYTNGRSLSALAREFDVYPSTIERVVKERTWRHIK